MLYQHSRCCISINRNIVECKYALIAMGRKDFFVLIETLWNVNEDITKTVLGEFLVLIETLWNVNRLAERASDFVDTSINRNIVECK